VRTICFIIIITLYALKIKAQAADTCRGRAEDRFRVLFILDASSSMERKWGKETLWDVAKKTIEEFAYYLQKNYNVEMGLRVYGHQSAYSENNCEDSKLEVAIDENSAAKITSKLKTIKCQGTTPLTYSLEKAAEDLGCNSKKNIIILITDGYETCNRNPCAMAEKLLDYRITIKPLIVGLNIDPKEIQHLHCIGDFKNAKNKEDFKKELFTSFTNVANRRSYSLFLKNGSKPMSETKIPFSVFNAKNKELIGSYYHHLSPSMKPDTITIGNYDSVYIKLHSTPAIFSEKLKLKKYVHNSFQLDYPKAVLNIKWDSIPNKIYDPIIGLIYNGSELVDKFTIPIKLELLEDKYTIALNTIPAKLYKDLSLNTTKEYVISLPTPGLLTVAYSSPIYGDLFYYDHGVLTKCYTLNSAKNIENLNVLPGTYKLIYRSQRSITIHGSFEKEFTILSGGNVNFSL
jgi:Ca-activated chloride channel homolog